MLDRFGLFVDNQAAGQEPPVSLTLVGPTRGKLGLDIADIPLALDPCTQPTSDITAARDGRKVIEPS